MAVGRLQGPGGFETSTKVVDDRVQGGHHSEGEDRGHSRTEDESRPALESFVSHGVSRSFCCLEFSYRWVCLQNGPEIKADDSENFLMCRTNFVIYPCNLSSTGEPAVNDLAVFCGHALLEFPQFWQTPLSGSDLREHRSEGTTVFAKKSHRLPYNQQVTAITHTNIRKLQTIFH